jgi:hypothetical protein
MVFRSAVSVLPIRGGVIRLGFSILILGTALTARDLTDWQNLRQLSATRGIEVVKKDGEAVKGSLARFSDDAITLQTKQGEVTVVRTDVSRVRLRSHRTRNTLIGAGIGAGAGAAVGAGLGVRLENESGGDFANLKGAVIGGFAAAGALVGAITGTFLGGRHAEIYRAP